MIISFYLLVMRVKVTSKIKGPLCTSLTKSLLWLKGLHTFRSLRPGYPRVSPTPVLFLRSEAGTISRLTTSEEWSKSCDQRLQVKDRVIPSSLFVSSVLLFLPFFPPPSYIPSVSCFLPSFTFFYEGILVSPVPFYP